MNSSGFNWFKLNRALHRDIGYFCVGLTIVFAVSGIAVNHIHEWNSNYSIERNVIKVPDFQWSTFNDIELNTKLVEQAKLEQPFKSGYWSSSQQYRLFLKDGSNLTLDIASNELTVEQISPRYVLQAFNKLHLNQGHKYWVIFSDIYAAMLLFLALSSLFMVKGKNSPWRSKSIWLLLGLLLPCLFIFIL